MNFRRDGDRRTRRRGVFLSRGPVVAVGVDVGRRRRELRARRDSAVTGDSLRSAPLFAAVRRRDASRLRRALLRSAGVMPIDIKNSRRSSGPSMESWRSMYLKSSGMEGPRFLCRRSDELMGMQVGRRNAPEERSTLRRALLRRMMNPVASTKHANIVSSTDNSLSTLWVKRSFPLLGTTNGGPHSEGSSAAGNLAVAARYVGISHSSTPDQTYLVRGR